MGLEAESIAVRACFTKRMPKHADIATFVRPIIQFGTESKEVGR